MWLVTRGGRTPNDVIDNNGQLCVEMYPNQLVPIPEDKDLNLVVSKVRGKIGYISDRRYWNDKA